MEIQLLSRIVRLEDKNCVNFIPNAPAKILTKTPLSVAGEDGIDSYIDFKKREQNIIFQGEKLRKKNLFPWQLAKAYTGTPPLTRFSYSAVFYLSRFF